MANFQVDEVSIVAHTMIASGKKLKPKGVVEVLMEKKTDCLRDVNAKHGGRTRKNVLHYVFSCLLEVNYRAGGHVYVDKGAGCTNPFKHLVACMSDGNAEQMFKIYNDAF